MIKHLPTRNAKAFTLVELLLVVALVAISVGVTGDILISLVRSYTKSQVLNEVEQQANFLSLKLEKQLRNASLIVLPEGTALGASVNSSDLNFVTNEGTTIRYYLESGIIKYRATSAGGVVSAAVNLTSSAAGGVSVTCPSSCFAVTNSTPQIVSYDFTFSQAQGGSSVPMAARGSITIKNTLVIRNTY